MEIKELTDKNYKKLIHKVDKNIFIDFYSPSCGPCQELKSFLPELNKYASKKDILVYKCNIVTNPEIRNYYKIESVPFTIVITKEKGMKFARSGLLSKNDYFKIIDSTADPRGFFKKLFNIR